MAVLQGAQVQLDLSDLGEGDGAGVLACELRVVPPATVKRWAPSACNAQALANLGFVVGLL